MKPVKIVNYVKKSFNNKPSFIILMSDGVEYISNGCVFAPVSERASMEIKRDCKKEMDELFAADGIDDSELVDGRWMYCGCEELTEPGKYPNLVDGKCMYANCEKLTEPGKYPNLVNGQYMYYGCEELTKQGNYPNLMDSLYMYTGCKKITNKITQEKQK